MDSQSGGGGGGGFEANDDHPVRCDYELEEVADIYTVTVGAGGIGGFGPNPTAQCGQGSGTRSEFYLNGESYPLGKLKGLEQMVVAVVQGCRSRPVPPMNGGSGGGAICGPSPYSGGTRRATPDPNHPQVQGYAGGRFVHQRMDGPMLRWWRWWSR